MIKIIFLDEKTHFFMYFFKIFSKTHFLLQKIFFIKFLYFSCYFFVIFISFICIILFVFNIFLIIIKKIRKGLFK